LQKKHTLLFAQEYLANNPVKTVLSMVAAVSAWANSINQVTTATHTSMRLHTFLNLDNMTPVAPDWDVRLVHQVAKKSANAKANIAPLIQDIILARLIQWLAKPRTQRRDKLPALVL